jgi:hypothetical protein
MVSIFFKSKCEGENLEERDFCEADFAKFTEDDKFLILYKLKSKNIAGDEVGRFRAEYIVGYIIDNDDE